MPISDDWNVGYAAKIISHIDGVLSYDTGGGAQADIGDYVYGVVSGALGKVLARTGDATSGTLTLTNVVGRFQNAELLEVLSTLDFDNVVNANKALIKVGATITGLSSASTLVLKFIEYNIDGVAGHGTFYGTPMSAVFTNDENLQINSVNVAVADGVGVDNDTKLTTTQVAGTLAVPGTVNTNNSVIIHYDNGTIAIPEDAHIADTVDLTNAEGYVQRVIGALATGSIRVVDSDITLGDWTDDLFLYIHDVVFYDALVAGSVFSVGDVVKAFLGTSPNAIGRVLAVIDDGDDTGKLILANMSGTWKADNEIHVLQSDDTYVKVAEVENTTIYLQAAQLNIPTAYGGVRDEQREDQGGIYAPGSVNIVRSANAFYSYLQDLYDELGALDDDPPMDGNVRDQLYTVLSDYIIPDLSFRFLEKGSFTDTAKANIFGNLQSAGVVADIGDNGYQSNPTAPTPQPDMYVEQDGVALRQDWLEGHVDINIKVKTKTDPAYINPAVAALGQLIDSGTVVLHLRPYRRTYDSSEITAPNGGQQAVFIANAPDLNNTTGQYTVNYTVGTMPFTVGEEIKSSDGLKRGIVNSSDSGATGTVTYTLKSATQFVNTDVVTGSVSGNFCTFGVPSDLVAGYDSDIKVVVVQRRFLGGTTTLFDFIYGEVVNQAVSGAVGYFLEDDDGTIYLEEQSGVFDGTNQLSGATSGALNTPTSMEAYTTVPKDIGGGVGDKNYTAVVSGNITGGGSPSSVLAVYEWWKFITRKESIYQINRPGLLFDDYWEGRLYRRLDTAFKEVRGASPFGSKAGSLVIGAQGVFIHTSTLDTADLRNIQLIDNLGDTYDPPNLQLMQVINLYAGVRAAIYRSTGTGNLVILRTEFKVGAVGGGYNQAGDNKILVAAQTRGVSPLPNDVPDAGILRILDPNGTGNYLRFIYDEVDRTNNFFTLTTGTIGDVTGAQDLIVDYNVHVVFVEDTSTGASLYNTVQHTGTDIPLFAKARIKGKKPFRTAAEFGSGGIAIGAVLQADDVVNLP